MKWQIHKEKLLVSYLKFKSKPYSKTKTKNQKPKKKTPHIHKSKPYSSMPEIISVFYHSWLNNYSPCEIVQSVLKLRFSVSYIFLGKKNLKKLSTINSLGKNTGVGSHSLLLGVPEGPFSVLLTGNILKYNSHWASSLPHLLLHHQLKTIICLPKTFSSISNPNY